MRLHVRRYCPKRVRHRRVHPVRERLYLYLRLRERQGSSYETIASLAPVSRVELEGSDALHVLPEDRARAWEELAGWIKHLVIFPDPVVREGQYRNRLKWERWERELGRRPREDELYDWRRDAERLERLRPRYQRAAERLRRELGSPRRADFDRRYPNRYGDEGLSDRARGVLRDLKALFGPEIFPEG